MFVYFTFCYIFQTHYFFHTTIDYIESSVQTVDTVSDILKDEFQKYSLHVIGREDTEVTISAKDVSLKVDTQDALAAVNITAPLFLISTGIGLMFGVGASVVASIHLSQGKQKSARINVTQAVVVSSLFLALLWGGCVCLHLKWYDCWEVRNACCLWR